MRVDFYQLSQGTPDKALAMLARAALRQGERMLIVAEDESRFAAIGDALWTEFPDTFLAHGIAGGPDDARQPILLSHAAQAANGARFMVLADGVWREGEDADAFDRVFYVFDETTIGEARATFAMLGKREGTERHYWAQEDGRWVKKA